MVLNYMEIRGFGGLNDRLGLIIPSIFNYIPLIIGGYFDIRTAKSFKFLYDYFDFLSIL